MSPAAHPIDFDSMVARLNASRAPPTFPTCTEIFSYLMIYIFDITNLELGLPKVLNSSDIGYHLFLKLFHMQGLLLTLLHRNIPKITVDQK